jgi:hypothetical protein
MWEMGLFRCQYGGLWSFLVLLVKTAIPIKKFCFVGDRW